MSNWCFRQEDAFNKLIYLALRLNYVNPFNPFILQFRSSHVTSLFNTFNTFIIIYKFKFFNLQNKCHFHEKILNIFLNSWILRCFSITCNGLILTLFLQCMYELTQSPKRTEGLVGEAGYMRNSINSPKKKNTFKWSPVQWTSLMIEKYGKLRLLKYLFQLT